MRLFIIGRLYDGDSLVAFKLYDADSKKGGIYGKEDIFKKVKEGLHVTGLRVNGENINLVKGLTFNVNKTDVLNGKGGLVKDTGSYVLLEYSGFLEDTKYRLVNSLGSELIVDHDTFIALIDAYKINGASRSVKIKGKINIYRHCDYREYWEDDENV